MNIGGLQAVTLLDFPGKVACTIFTQGCNFRCHYCHNPELVLPEQIKIAPQIKEADFWSFLEERKNFLEGVCITGGEPTMQGDLYDFIKKIKGMGLAVKLDTNGTDPSVLEKLLNEDLLDYVAMDIKHLPERYQEVVNLEINIDDIKKSVNLLKSSKIDYEFRTTVMGDLLNEKDILAIADWLAPAKAYNLQYARTGMDLVNSDYTEKKNPMSKMDLEKIHEKIKDKFKISKLR